MIKLKTIQVKTSETKVVSGKCDWCGNPFDKEVLKLDNHPYGEVEVRFGFGSNFDSEEWIGEICDDCFTKHLKPKIRFNKDIL